MQQIVWGHACAFLSRAGPAEGPAPDASWVVLAQGIAGVSYNRAGGYYSITGGCGSLSSLPDIAFRIDGHAYYMPPVQWTQAVRPLHLP